MFISSILALVAFSMFTAAACPEGRTEICCGPHYNPGWEVIALPRDLGRATKIVIVTSAVSQYPMMARRQMTVGHTESSATECFVGTVCHIQLYSLLSEVNIARFYKMDLRGRISTLPDITSVGTRPAHASWITVATTS
ncbi:hypothetical protein BJ138DRAFT_1105299 [Hygrophoropsis aurantiaca]|uniref:Uncharacterized protein n=1 Tax=Hygrophoropsis aurantiaca TaxID=72124 RepID=A0ACB7ZYU2_9AGAM|nr:hypothetical protein BJ138DRAFT_1105299 [Hygrophoropsis aurantiaca]